MSWAAVLAIGGFYAWATIAPSGYPATLIAAAFLACVVLALLKVGVRKPVVYWEAAGSPDQAGRVGLMILTAVAIQFVAGVCLTHVSELEWLSYLPLYLVVWFGVPLAFLVFGGVRWPQRLAKPRMSDFLAVAGLAIAFATAMCFLQMPKVEAPEAAPSLAEILVACGVKVLGATAEEVVYRVLLLTALLRASGSRVQALIISSTAFALGHVPLAFTIPLAMLDGEMLRFYATQYFPELVWIIGMGFVFGALWLRTGSIALIVIFHTILNLAPALVAGFRGL
jgi:membrane protease YdiL (CAAX protease family)